MFHKVTVDTELANAELPLPGEGQVRFLKASGHNTSVNGSLHNLVLCFQMPYVTGHWFMRGELADSAVTPVWQSLPNTHIFSARHMMAFLHLGTLNSTSALGLGAALKSKITTKKKKGEEKRRKCGGRSTTKRTLVCSTRAETVRRRVTLSPSALFNTSTECLEFFATLPTSTSDRENSGKHCVLGYRSMLAGRCVRKHGNPWKDEKRLYMFIPSFQFEVPSICAGGSRWVPGALNGQDCGPHPAPRRGTTSQLSELLLDWWTGQDRATRRQGQVWDTPPYFVEKLLELD